VLQPPHRMGKVVDDVVFAVRPVAINSNNAGQLPSSSS
jgi:hypothetical protein